MWKYKKKKIEKNYKKKILEKKISKKNLEKITRKNHKKKIKENCENQLNIFLTKNHLFFQLSPKIANFRMKIQFF